MKQTYKVAFGDVKVGKKTTIAIEIKGTLSDEQKLSLLEFANSDGFVTLASAQSDIQDYGVPVHRGLKATIDNGSVSVDPDQLDIDDVIQDDTYKVVNEDGVEHTESGNPSDDGEPSEEEEQEPEGDGYTEEVELVAAIALMEFKYQGVELKKGAELNIPRADIEMFVNNKLVKIAEKEDDLSDSLI